MIELGSVGVLAVIVAAGVAMAVSALIGLLIDRWRYR